MGNLHLRSVMSPVTSHYVKELVAVGMMRRTPKGGTKDWQWHQTADDMSRGTIPTQCDCIRGLQGSWVMWGPMRPWVYHETGKTHGGDCEFDEVHAVLDRKFGKTTLHMRVDVVVGKDGIGHVLKWNEYVPWQTMKDRERVMGSDEENNVDEHGIDEHDAADARGQKRITQYFQAKDANKM